MFKKPGDQFNALKLNPDGLPHNPLINAGAMMISSLVKPRDEQSARFEYVKTQW